MTDLSPALDAALAGDRVAVFGALTLTVGSDTLHLLDGSAEITVNGTHYTGSDATYGVWSGLDAFEDGTGDEAPGMVITLLPASDDATLALSGPDMQGESVRVMVGAINEATGAIIGEPFVLFDGEVDVTKHTFGKGEVAVELDCVGGMERLFFNDEGLLLAPSFHQQVWPGELGFNHVTGIRDVIYWGANAPTESSFIFARAARLMGQEA